MWSRILNDLSTTLVKRMRSPVSLVIRADSLLMSSEKRGRRAGTEFIKSKGSSGILTHCFFFRLFVNLKLSQNAGITVNVKSGAGGVNPLL